MACPLFGTKAIIWTNAALLSIGPLGTNFSQIVFEIQTFSFKKMILKMLSGKFRPFCLGLSVLKGSHCPEINAFVTIVAKRPVKFRQSLNNFNTKICILLRFWTTFIPMD